MKTFFAMALVIAFAFAGQAKADHVLIDTFNTGANLFNSTTGSTATQTTTASMILGGDRVESVTVPSGDIFGLFSYNGAWNVAQGATDEISGSLTYDNFTNFDLTMSGLNTNFLIDVVSNDAGPAVGGVLSVEVQSAGVTESVGFSLPATSALPQGVTVQFADFTATDFTQVDSIALVFDTAGNPGLDFSISNFSAVPEPTGGVIALGLLCGLYMRRKRSV